MSIVGGRRLNTPRTYDGEDMETSSPSASAIVLEPSHQRASRTAAST